MQQFDISLGALIFSNAGEVELHRDDRFEKLINNSLGLSESQFQFLAAVSAGSVAVNAQGGIEALVDELDNDGFYMCQPPRRPTRNDAQGRQYILVYGVFPTRNKIRRIFIRHTAVSAPKDATAGQATALDTLFKIARPAALIKEVTNQLMDRPVLPIPRKQPGREVRGTRKVFGGGKPKHSASATARIGAHFPAGMGEKIKEQLHNEQQQADLLEAHLRAEAVEAALEAEQEVVLDKAPSEAVADEPVIQTAGDPTSDATPEGSEVQSIGTLGE